VNMRRFGLGSLVSMECLEITVGDNSWACWRFRIWEMDGHKYFGFCGKVETLVAVCVSYLASFMCSMLYEWS
jgi:hypothetical protein